MGAHTVIRARPGTIAFACAGSWQLRLAMGAVFAAAALDGRRYQSLVVATDDRRADHQEHLFEMTGDAFTLEGRRGGLYLPALDLWLDPGGDVPRAFASHAHGDHVGGGGSAMLLGSVETLSLVATRRGDPPPGARPIEWEGSIELPIAREHGGGTARLSIAPAGHVLGAAQLVVDHPRGRLVYTGDYRTGGGPTHATGAPVPCDALIIESTFALPIFKFPSRHETCAAIVAWCRARLDEGELPVLLAYALGKSQELVHILLEAGLPVVAHGAVHRVCAAYESLGVPQGVADGRLRPYAEEKKRTRLEGVLIVPPSAQAQPMVRRRREARIGYVSGWALLDAAVEQRRADAGFALSDHADWDDLVATVRASGARRVWATHGDARVLAGHLVEQGVDATAIEAPPLDAHEERG